MPVKLLPKPWQVRTHERTPSPRSGILIHHKPFIKTCWSGIDEDHKRIISYASDLIKLGFIEQNRSFKFLHQSRLYVILKIIPLRRDIAWAPNYTSANLSRVDSITHNLDSIGLSLLTNPDLLLAQKFEKSKVKDQREASPADQISCFSTVNKIPARYMARVAQAFTTTKRVITLQPSQIKIMDDVICNGSIFTDGVGLISI
ncbi:hypothetical protein H4Q26_018050 [Puccinia striiformis f. sp. tritici PST-130]|nr:hypothetical protein H4Q26_018050 [Puccinia striiformis f. sp. tritici PST-130]